MPNYDLAGLDDKEFEVLSCRLLSKLHDARYERFKPGRDQGVDGRYFSPGGGEVILQCKHWVRSNASALIRSLEKTELVKLQKLRPVRYIIVTSVELSRADKQKIASIFSGYLASESDIFGLEDINDLLARAPEVVRAHPGLWLASAEIIGLIQNAAILGRSDFSLDEIRQKATRYVATRSHIAAKARLESLGAVLITGLPGIGKTTLAEQICLEYVLDGYQLCVLGESIEEAEAIFNKDKKQVFYFDDFLGRNYLEALGRHEDSRIVGFIRRVQKDATKRFVMTSRTTVLNQAKLLSDQFEIAKVNKTEIEIRVEGLDLMDRARILHKHVWYSDLRVEVLAQLIASGRHLEVVKHPNFNPRLIQFITDAQRFDSDDPNVYWSYVQETLANPAAVWQHVLDSQLDDYSRVLLLLCCYNGGLRIAEAELRDAFTAFKAEPVAQGYRGNPEFVRNTRLVTGSVLTRLIGPQHSVYYTLFNPSVADYVYSRNAADADLLLAIFCSLKTCPSLATLKNLIANNYLPLQTALAVIEGLIQRALADAAPDLDYQIALAAIAASPPEETSSIRSGLEQLAPKILDELDSDISDWEMFGNLLVRCVELGVLHTEQLPSVFSTFADALVNADELAAMAELFSTLDTESQMIIRPLFKSKVLDYWQDSIGEAIADSGVLDDFLSEDDLADAASAALTYVENRLDLYPFAFTPAEIRSVLHYVDIGDFVYSNQKRESRSSYRGESVGAASNASDDAINDLFNIDLPT